MMSNDRSTSANRVVIVGGGFAGVTLAQRLEGLVAASTEIVVLSSENHFVFTPLLAETVGREIPRCTLYCRDARWSAARNG